MSESSKVSKIGRRNFVRSAALLASTTQARSKKAPISGESAGCITDVAGVRVGHFTDSRRPTGCTVVIFDRGAIAGVDVRGSAPGTRETDLLNPVNTVQKVNAILLSGGSAFGLDAATGVMRYLEEHELGYRIGSVVVPIVPAAILFDLQIGDSKIRPDAAAGYAACQAASSSNFAEGNVGAGAGASVGKLFGVHAAMKSGIGTSSIKIQKTGLVVGAIVAVNAAGDVIDFQTGKILAGARTPDGEAFRDSKAQIVSGYTAKTKSGENTTIGVVATNAALNKGQVTKVAQMAQDGLARTINPVHTMFDGDAIFAASTGQEQAPADLSAVGVIAAEVLARAINRAVIAATGIPGYPAFRDIAER